MEHLPDGPALLVGNHNSGTSFYEALGTGARVYVERGLEEPMHGLGHDAVVDAPLFGRILVRAGTVRASQRAGDVVLAAGRKLWVFPGGNLEAFRPWRRRHEIDFGGRKGFLRLALRHRVPIVPVVFIGGHEAFFVLRDGRRLARLLRAERWLRSDTWPLMVALPWGIALGPLPHLPLPVRCTTRFLPPISLEAYAPDAADDPQVLEELYAEVTGKMQTALEDLARERSQRRG